MLTFNPVRRLLTPVFDQKIETITVTQLQPQVRCGMCSSIKFKLNILLIQEMLSAYSAAPADRTYYWYKRCCQPILQPQLTEHIIDTRDAVSLFCSPSWPNILLIQELLSAYSAAPADRTHYWYKRCCQPILQPQLTEHIIDTRDAVSLFCSPSWPNTLLIQEMLSAYSAAPADRTYYWYKRCCQPILQPQLTEHIIDTRDAVSLFCSPSWPNTLLIQELLSAYSAAPADRTHYWYKSCCQPILQPQLTEHIIDTRDAVSLFCSPSWPNILLIQEDLIFKRLLLFLSQVKKKTIKHQGDLVLSRTYKFKYMHNNKILTANDFDELIYFNGISTCLGLFYA